MAKYKTRRRKNYDRTEPPRDYMKYWRVVKYWTRNKYDITLGELDMMLFLYSEGIFNKDQFDEFNRLVGWNKNRFKSLLSRDWIVKWRNHTHNEKALYELSFKGKRMVSNVYDKLNGKEFSENAPMFKANAGYNDRAYREYIMKINASIQRQQRHAPE